MESNPAAAFTLPTAAVLPSYDTAYAAVNVAARDIATDAISAANGRLTYSWEGNGIRLIYAGDTVGDNGDAEFGPTTREYRVNGQWKTVSPEPSQSGTGLLNLHLGHVKDCTDPIVEAKRRIAFLLMDPSLDLVGFVMRTSTAWHGLMSEPFQIRSALAIRLAEVIEQKVLENPESGLNLQKIADGTNIVGWAVQTLDGTIFNLMKRILTNESKNLTTLDHENDDDSATRMAPAHVDAQYLPASAEDEAIQRDEDSRALMTLERMAEEISSADTAKASGQKVRVRRQAEKDALVSRMFLQQTGLPNLQLPAREVRVSLAKALAKQLSQQAAEMKLVVDHNKMAKRENKQATDPSQFIEMKALPIFDADLAYASFQAWHNLLHGECEPGDADVVDEWLDIWETWTATDTETLMMLVSNGREGRVAKIVLGLLRPSEKLSDAAKTRIMAATTEDAPNAYTTLVTHAVAMYDKHRQGLPGAEALWTAAAGDVIAHPFSSASEVRELAEMFDDAIFALE